MNIGELGVTAPNGFRAAGAAAGIKKANTKDMAMICSVVPCTVAGALNEAGAFGPAVLEQDRYKAIDKTLFDVPWVFTTKFSAPAKMRNVLRFNSLGYSADIELNGVRLASADTTAMRGFCVLPSSQLMK